MHFNRFFSIRPSVGGLCAETRQLF